MKQKWNVKTPIIYNIKDLAVFVRESNAIENIHHKLDYVLEIIETWHSIKDKVERKMFEQTVPCEIIQHYKAVRWALRHSKEEINWLWIHKVHDTLMKGQLGPTERGFFRRVQVYVGNHIPPAPGERLLIASEKFLKMLTWAIGYLDGRIVPTSHEADFKKIYHLHCAYETLHPYIDGNGRSGRILWLSLLHKYGFNFTHICFDLRRYYYGSLQTFQEHHNIEDVTWFPINQGKI